MPNIQLIKPNLETTDDVYMCLRHARRVFGVKAVHANAWLAWDATKHFSRKRDMPTDVAVLVWFSWWGTLNGVRANYGHVVVWVPGRGYLSTPTSGHGQKWYPNIESIEEALPGAKFVGWSYDINGVRVAEWREPAKPAPKPVPKPAPSSRVGTRISIGRWWNYRTAADAKAMKNGVLVMPAGTYEITQMHDGVPHLKKVGGGAMGWVHASVLTAAPIAAPKTYTVKRGDTLSKIAKAHGTTWQKLQSLNSIKNANILHAGQVIRLP